MKRDKREILLVRCEEEEEDDDEQEEELEEEEKMEEVCDDSYIERMRQGKN